MAAPTTKEWKAMSEAMTTTYGVYAEKAQQDEIRELPTAHLPRSVTVEGTRYYYTGKTGTTIATGEPSQEYATTTDARLWMTASGSITLD